MKKYGNVRNRKNLLIPFARFTGVFPGASVVKNLPTNARNVGDLGSITGSGRSPGGGNDNLLQYSCLENLMNRGAWWAIVHQAARVGHDLATKPPHGDCS